MWERGRARPVRGENLEGEGAGGCAREAGRVRDSRGDQKSPTLGLQIGGNAAVCGWGQNPQGTQRNVRPQRSVHLRFTVLM